MCGSEGAEAGMKEGQIDILDQAMEWRGEPRLEVGDQVGRAGRR